MYRSMLMGVLVLTVVSTAAHAEDYPALAVPRLEGVTIEGLPAVTGRIHVDQFGYLPSADKVAVISDPQRGYNSMDHYTPGEQLEVRERQTGAVVHRGAPVIWQSGQVHEDSGDRGWWFDFSSVRKPGEYYIYDPSTERRSPVFRVADDVYVPILRAALRTAAFLQDRQTRYVHDRDNDALVRDMSGGWMDAGDTNKYPPFNHEAIHPLLYAYRANPGAFPDNHLNIPESGNGLPDLLDEVKFQLDWLIKMQDEDGGVFVKMGDIAYDGSWPLHTDKRTRYYGRKCTGAAIFTAAIFAHAARVYGQFEPWRPFAAELEQRAKLAWRYYQANPKTYESDQGEIKSGNASRGEVEQNRMEAFAGVHLFALTGEEAYHDAIRRHAGETRQLGEGYWSPYDSPSGEALIDYLSLPKADAQLKQRIREQLARSAGNPAWAPPVEVDLYRAYMNPNAYHWGSSTVRSGYGVTALHAAEHGRLPDAEQQRLRQRAGDMLHSFHGVNPLSAVYLSNMDHLGAERSMRSIWHARYPHGTPFEKNPPPGYVVGGASQQFKGKDGDKPGLIEWVREQPRGKAYADFNLGWPHNSWELSEPGIYYQARYIRLLSEFVPPAPASQATP